MIKLLLIAWAIVGGCIYAKLYMDERLPTKSVLKNRVCYGILGPIAWASRAIAIGYDRLKTWLESDRIIFDTLPEMDVEMKPVEVKPDPTDV